MRCHTLAACLRRCMSGCATCLPLAAVVAAARSRSAAATSRAACSSSTCGSGLPAPSDMAPSFTTSHSCTATTTTVTISRSKHCGLFYGVPLTDSADSVLRGRSQLLLRSGGSPHQRLGVFDERLRRFKYVLAVVRERVVLFLRLEGTW